jgi:hypothetical protein
MFGRSSRPVRCFFSLLRVPEVIITGSESKRENSDSHVFDERARYMSEAIVSIISDREYMENLHRGYCFLRELERQKVSV